MNPIVKAECGRFSVRLYCRRRLPPWSFHGLIVYGFKACWFL